MESTKTVLQDINLSIYSDDNLEVSLEKESLEFHIEEVELEKIIVHFSFKTNNFGFKTKNFGLFPLLDKSYVIKAVSSKYMYTLYNCNCYIEENYIKGTATGIKYNVL